ncbi:MAG: HD domain-containing protein [Candidatus Sericytochromatia bacterium]
MSTAETVRYIAYALYAISLVYAIAIVIPILMGGKNSNKSGGSSGRGSDSLELINQWAQKADEYEANPGHSRRVADLARQIGEKYGLPKEELDMLEYAALLHDVGQINNFDFINEARPLQLDEKIKLEGHTLLGEDFAKQIPSTVNAPLWIRWHHERWDGMGYPDQLSGEMIPLPVRILSVADAYDSLTHDRPHRSAMSAEEAIKELQRMSGIMFDPNVIQVFMSIDSEVESGRSLEV